jgi:4-amino-4-deoxy-L-arabinose transferase-like glycosyltransferase
MNVLVPLAVFASFFWMLGQAPLFDVDEGAFSQATMEMFQRGDFLSTYLNGQPRYDKPILVYWLQAAAVALLGPVELAFRLPSAICATLWALLTYWFVERNYDRERALLAAALLVTSLGVTIIGRAATADALLNCLIAASMFAAWLHLSTGERRWLYAAHAAIGLGLLAKGPIALLVPGAVTFLFCILRRDLKTWLRAVLDWRALLLLLVIAAPWYAVILYKEGWGFVDGFILRHNAARFGGPMQGHGGSLLYYFPVLLALTLPFTALLVPVAQGLKAMWRDDLQTYLLLWFAFVFVFFSLSGTKLPHYLLYGVTGLVILAALRAAELKSAFWILIPAVLLFLFFLLLPQVFEFAMPRVRDPYYREALSNAGPYFVPGYFIFCSAALALLFYAMLERRFALPPKLAAAGLLTVIAVSSLVAPLLGDVLQAPIKEAALLAKARKLEPVMWRLNAPSFSVYRGAPTASREPRPGDVVMTKARRLAELPAGTSYESIYAKNGIVLVRLGR